MMSERYLSPVVAFAFTLMLGTGMAYAAIINAPSEEVQGADTTSGGGHGSEEGGPIRMRTPSASENREALSQLASQGDVEAMLELGYSYYRPDSNSQSLGVARRWFKQASDTKDLRGMLAYGYMLSQGLGGEKDMATARKFLTHAADLGVARAVYLLSQIEGAQSGAKKKDLAQKLLMQAVDMRDPVALNTLGVQQELAGDTARARVNFLLAARYGNSTAKTNLDRINRVSKRAQRASLQEVKEKASRKDAESLFQLAQRYHRGDGVTRDFNKAFAFYQDAAKRGSAAANEMVQLILLKPNPNKDLPFDPAWMQELSSRALTLIGEERDSKHYLPMRNPDPLWGLLFEPGTPGSILPATEDILEDERSSSGMIGK